jgi:pyruvate-formate lyase-activating enzyme
MDLKQIFSKYNQFTNLPPQDIEKSFKFIKSSDIPHEFRITTHPDLSLNDFNSIIDLTDGENVFIQDFVNLNTLKIYNNYKTIFSKLKSDSNKYKLR